MSGVTLGNARGCSSALFGMALWWSWDGGRAVGTGVVHIVPMGSGNIWMRGDVGAGVAGRDIENAGVGRVGVPVGMEG